LVGVAHYEETIQGVDGVLTWTVDGPPIDVGAWTAATEGVAGPARLVLARDEPEANRVMS
jgi:hypothetical protein